MYKIIGADQKEYGPISADQIRQWISEGRLNAQSQVCLEGTQEWKPLGTFPEFGFMATPAAAPSSIPGAPVPTEQILAGDYTLDIGQCISRGWNLFKNNFPTLFVPFLLIAIISFVTSGAAQMVLKAVGMERLPFAQRTYLSTPVMLIVAALVQGPLMGGLYYINLCVIRARGTNMGDLFIGYKNVFADLFLGKLVMGLIISLCLLPYSIVSAERLAPIMDRLQQQPPSGHPQELMSQMFSAFFSTAPAFFLCMIPVTYLSVNWIFALALIVDRQMGFWSAMTTSWKMVHKHWFHVFGLVVMIGLINVAGFCACCIGLLITVPFGTTALMVAYEDIFGRKVA